MPAFTRIPRAPSTAISSTATIDAPTPRRGRRAARRQRLNVVKIDEAAHEEEEDARQDQDARHRHLHASVLDDDQRRPAARAGARHPREAEREQGAAGRDATRSCSTSSPATPSPTRSRKHPKAFSELYVNMVAAGEAGGILDTILMRLATFMEKNDALVRKVKGAMIYPGVIMSVAGDRDRACCSSSSFRCSRTCSAQRRPRAAAADAHRDRDVAASSRATGGADRRRSSAASFFAQEVLRDAGRQARRSTSSC